jgi:hypothetical protein
MKEDGGRNRRKMKVIRYTIEQREWAIQQMMPPKYRAVVELAKTTGITAVTLRKWQEMARAEGRIVPGDGKRSDQWSSTDKFRIVLEAAPLSQAELAAYCRMKSVYPEQVAQWRLACEQANVPTGDARARPKVNANQSQRIRELERTLKKKDAALAEAAALLILEKKAEAIWGKGKAE